ncbi:WecB/TagA/CpsF family glycosyltransferase [bacterium]|nr:WecB/TagA/CpsF family glycosyltransferase [bacterium]
MPPVAATPILGAPVSALKCDQLVNQMVKWAESRESRVVCVANVHMVMEAHSDPTFCQVLEAADLVTPDGMPLVWALRLFGKREQDRAAGMDLLMAISSAGEQRGLKLFLVGSTPEVLSKIRARLAVDYPRLIVVGAISPPFRDLMPEEEAHTVAAINASGAHFVLVALGCPKQEKWMGRHRGQIEAVMVGLGGAFPVYAGIQKRAPAWMRNIGLEWVFRLALEPKRLWRRYFTTNLPFVWLLSIEVVHRFLVRR